VIDQHATEVSDNATVHKQRYGDQTSAGSVHDRAHRAGILGASRLRLRAVSRGNAAESTLDGFIQESAKRHGRELFAAHRSGADEQRRCGHQDIEREGLP